MNRLGPSILLSLPRPSCVPPAASAMARVIAEGYTTVPWAPGGDPGAWDLAANLSTLAFPDGRTVWDEFCARHGLSANAAWMLRLVGRDTLVEFAAWAPTEQEFVARCTRPWLQGFLSPGSRGWVVCPSILRGNDRRALLAMWRQARVHLDWLAEDSPGRAYTHDPLWGLASLPARWAPQWAVHTHQTGDSDDDPLFGCLRDEDIPEFEPPIRVLEWPVVPTGPFAPGARRDYYLARLGPWALGQGGALPSPRRRGGHGRQVRAAHRGRQGSRHGLAPARRRARRAAVAVVPRVLGRQVHEPGGLRERHDPRAGVDSPSGGRRGGGRRPRQDSPDEFWKRSPSLPWLRRPARFPPSPKYGSSFACASSPSSPRPGSWRRLTRQGP